MAAFVLKQESLVVATKMAWLTRPKIFSIWPFRKVYRPLLKTMAWGTDKDFLHSSMTPRGSGDIFH